MQNVLTIILLATTVVLSSCGPKAFTKGSYDDPTRVELLDDQFNENDMQQLADQVINDTVSCEYIKNAPKEPFVIVEKVQNRTEEHIDTTSLTDKVRTALIKSGKLRFVNKQERGTLEEEYKHAEGGNIDPVTAKKRGKQIGADYILSGSLATNIQQVGDDKLIYYKLTVNLTNLETSAIDCVSEKEIRKKYKKRSVGL